MARKAMIVKTEKRLKKAERAAKDGRKLKHPTRVYNRCKLCGRSRGYLRMFEMCRICFREKASTAQIVGVKKASW